jgi:FMN phosphatase YigB (HAD superfamily)
MNNHFSPAPAVRNFLFDLGNVILDIDIPGTINRLRSFLRPGISEEPFHYALEEYECGKISTDIFINSLLKLSTHRTQALDVMLAWNGMLIGIPPQRLEMLERLRRNFQVYLLSNTNELHIDWLHQYMEKTYGIPDFESRFFDNAFYSFRMGDRKPNASIFQLVIDTAGIRPESTLFLDDLPDNIQVARELGFQTLLVNPADDITTLLGNKGYV